MTNFCSIIFVIYYITSSTPNGSKTSENSAQQSLKGMTGTRQCSRICRGPGKAAGENGGGTTQ